MSFFIILFSVLNLIGHSLYYHLKVSDNDDGSVYKTGWKRKSINGQISYVFKHNNETYYLIYTDILQSICIFSTNWSKYNTLHITLFNWTIMKI